MLAGFWPLGRILASVHALCMSGFLTPALASSCSDLWPYALIFTFHVLANLTSCPYLYLLRPHYNLPHPRYDLPRPRHCLPRPCHYLPRPRLCLHIPTSTFLYPARMSTSGGSWVCSECGKVCKSRGGLTQHSAVHKRHPRVRELNENSTHFYHPDLDSRSKFLFSFASPNLLKENHADRTESSSPMTPHLFSHSLNPTMIGLRLNRVLGSNLLRSYTAKPLS